MQHYIRLMTTDELTQEQMDDWVDAVVQFSPEGVVTLEDAEDDLSGDNVWDEESDITADGVEGFPYVYTIGLARNLQPREAEFIVASWSQRYDGDFEIEISHLYNHEVDQQRPIEVDMDDETLKEVAANAAKMLHNRWVDEKIASGWRYGLKLNESDKTHPALRDWDSLPAEYRKHPTITKREAFALIQKYPDIIKP